MKSILFLGIVLLLNFVCGNNDTYSYICLQDNQELCLGISIGNAIPVYGDSYKLQLKKRDVNDSSPSNLRKISWFFSEDYGYIRSYRYPLYMRKRSRSGSVFVEDKFSVFNISSFKTNINEAGVIKLLDEDECLTVMQCNLKEGEKTKFCNPNTNNPVTRPGQIKNGAYVRFRPCDYSYSQIFRTKLDCAPGCTPFDVENAVCNSNCNVTTCPIYPHNCSTLTPTLSPLGDTPSPSLTPQPTSSSPVLQSQAPSLSPQPTQQHTVPPTTLQTHNPSPNPETNTPSPTNQSLSPKPSAAPSKTVPSDIPVFIWIIIICCILFVFAVCVAAFWKTRNRRTPEESDLEDEDEDDYEPDDLEIEDISEEHGNIYAISLDGPEEESKTQYSEEILQIDPESSPVTDEPEVPNTPKNIDQTQHNYIYHPDSDEFQEEKI